MRITGVSIVLLCLLACLYDTAGGQSVSYAWGHNIGSSMGDEGYDVAIDANGDVYHVGYTWGQVGDTFLGPTDGYMVKMNAAGQRLWAKQITNSTGASAFSVAADPSGGVLVTGCAAGMGGQPDYGGGDVFVAKYSAAGDRMWVTQFGGDRQDQGRKIAVDRLGNIYVSGYTWSGCGHARVDGYTDAFVAKVSPTGQFQWVRQYGLAGQDDSYAVSTDSAGNVYMAGTTAGSIGGPNAGGNDVFVVKLAPDGTELWARQYGTASHESSSAVLADDFGNVYVAERALRKLSASGDLIWSKSMPAGPYQSSATAFARQLASDGQGGVLAGCYTFGSYAGPRTGITDVVLAHLNGDGNLISAKQVGGVDNNDPRGIAFDGSGRVYISGRIEMGGMPGSAFLGGAYDGFLTAWDVTIPEPSTVSLLAVYWLANLWRRRGALSRHSLT